MLDFYRAAEELDKSDTMGVRAHSLRPTWISLYIGCFCQNKYRSHSEKSSNIRPQLAEFSHYSHSTKFLTVISPRVSDLVLAVDSYARVSLAMRITIDRIGCATPYPHTHKTCIYTFDTIQIQRLRQKIPQLELSPHQKQYIAITHTSSRLRDVTNYPNFYCTTPKGPAIASCTLTASLVNKPTLLSSPTQQQHEYSSFSRFATVY